MNERYTWLPIVSLALKILALVIIAVGFVTAAYYLVSGKPGIIEGFKLPEEMRGVEYSRVFQPGFLHGHLVPAIWEFLNSVTYGLLLIAASEGIHVIMDIEENTRKAADPLGRGTPGTPRV